MANFGGSEGGLSALQTVDKKLFSPEGGRIALSANERIAEFLNFAIQVKFVYVYKLLNMYVSHFSFGLFPQQARLSVLDAKSDSC